MSGISLPSSSSVPTDTPLSPPVIIVGDVHPVEPAPKRKPGRPRKDESSRGKAPMDPLAPKRARGRPRKDKPSVFQTEPSPHLVSYDEFHTTVGELKHHYLTQVKRQGEVIDRLTEEVKSTNEVVRLQQEILGDMLRWDQADGRRFERIEAKLKDITSHLEKTTGFKPSAPPA